MARGSLPLVLAVACAAAVVAAKSARADGVGTGDRQDWTSRGYPRSWRPDEGLPDRQVPAMPPTVQVAPPSYERAYVPPAARAVPSYAPTYPPSYAPSCAPPCPAPCDVQPPCPYRPFDVWARWWRARPCGDTKITLGGEPGTGETVDVCSDLSMDAGNAFAGGIAWRFWGRNRVFLEYENLSFEGTTTLSRPLVFHGSTFPLGETVKSELDLSFWKAGYDFGALVGQWAEVRVGASAWVWTFREQLQGLNTGLDDERAFTHVLPVAHVVAEGAYGVLHGFARLEYGLVGSDRWMGNLSGGVGVRLWNRVNFDLGYRWMRFVFHETTNEGDLSFYGPFLQASIEL